MITCGVRNEKFRQWYSFLRGLQAFLLKSVGRAATLAVALAVAPLFGLPSLGAQEPTDQLVAVVNGEVVTQSDLIWLLALDPDAGVVSITPETLAKALKTKLDRMLLDQDAKRLPSVQRITDEEIADAKRKIVERFTSESVFRQRAESVGLDAASLNRIIREQIEIEKYIAFRFRAFVIVTEDDITEYYRAKIRPEVQKRGQVAPEEATEEQRRLIFELISRDRAEQEQARWLESARARAEITPLAPYAQTLVKGGQ